MLAGANDSAVALVPSTHYANSFITAHQRKLQLRQCRTGAGAAALLLSSHSREAADCWTADCWTGNYSRGVGKRTPVAVDDPAALAVLERLFSAHVRALAEIAFTAVDDPAALAVLECLCSAHARALAEIVFAQPTVVDPTAGAAPDGFGQRCCFRHLQFGGTKQARFAGAGSGE